MRKAWLFLLACFAFVVWTFLSPSLDRTSANADEKPGKKRTKRKPPQPEEELVQATHAALSDDGKLLLVAYRSNMEGFTDTLQLWDATTGKRLRAYAEEDLDHLYFLPGAKRALVSGHGRVFLLKIPSGKPVRAIDAYQRDVGLIALSLDGKHVLTLGNDGKRKLKEKLKLWSLGTGKLLREIAFPSQETCDFLTISPDCRYALTAAPFNSQKGWVRLWDLKAAKVVRAWKVEKGWSGPVAFSPDSKLALAMRTVWTSAGAKTHLVLWRVATGEPLRNFIGEDDLWIQAGGGSPQVAFLPGGKRVVARGQDHDVLFYDIKTGKQLRSAPARPAKVKAKAGTGKVRPKVCAFALSADGLRAVVIGGKNHSGNLELTVRIWDLAKGKLLKQWRDPSWWVSPCE
jgi:WD40 repeat protein